MPLVDHLRKGVRLEGLYRLLVPDLSAFFSPIVAGKTIDKPKPRGNPFAPFDATWTYKKGGFLKAATITFTRDGGENAIRILPYEKGKNAETLVGTGEVLSGEFNGCIMGVYTGDDDAVHVNHVDTDGSTAGSPCAPKKEWMDARGVAGANTQNEFTTMGLLTQFDTKDPFDFVLCIASAQAGYPIHAILVKRDVVSGVYSVLKRVKQTKRSMEDQDKKVEFI